MRPRRRGTAVFVGPTLHGWDRRQLGVGFTFFPPARVGDLSRAARGGFERIVLIDGCFIESRPPSPTETLECIRDGVEVWGTASLGALRAVELERYGMHGHGWVFRQFRNRRLFADDEVMVVYDADSGRRLSEPLVSMRRALLGARPYLEGRAARRILRRLAGLYFPDRTLQAFEAILRQEIGRRRTVRLLADYARYDVKREDASTLLRRLAGRAR